MQQVVIHCGFRKAGSTSIQRLLRAERAKLTERVGLTVRDNITEDFRRIAMRYVRNRDKQQLSGLPFAADKICSHVKKSKHKLHIVSDENLIGSAAFHPDGTDIFDWAAELLPILEGSLSEFDLIFYFVTRDSEQWMKSAYQQEVYNNYLTLTFEEWRAQYPKRLNWQSGMAKIIHALNSKCVVRKMEDLLADGPILGRDLLLTAGLDEDFVDSLQDPGRANVRVGGDAIEFIRSLNSSSLSNRQIKEVRNLIEKNRGMFK